MKEELLEERGQMAVELAALMPVMLVCLVILWNLARFVSACVLFDRVAQDAVLAEAASAGPSESSLSAASAAEAAVRTALGDAEDCDVAVAAEGAGDSPPVLLGEPQLVRFRCTLSFHPWPRRFVVAGIDADIPVVLVHEREVMADAGQAGRAV